MTTTYNIFPNSLCCYDYVIMNKKGLFLFALLMHYGLWIYIQSSYRKDYYLLAGCVENPRSEKTQSFLTIPSLKPSEV